MRILVVIAVTGLLSCATLLASPPQEQSAAATLLARANEHLSEARYESAAFDYELILAGFPESPEAAVAIKKILEAQYGAEDYSSALETVDFLLTQELTTAEMRRVLEIKFEIGFAYLSGTKRPFMGFKVSAKGYGVEILDSLVEQYPYERNSDRALFLIGSFYLDQGSYGRAEFVYGRLIQEYPKSKWLSLAQYQSGESALKRVKGIEYDLSSLDDAESRYRRYLARHAGGDKAQEARRRLAEIDRMRAQRLYSIAEFYIRERKPKSSRIYLQRILKDHPETSIAKDAAELLQGLGESPADNRKSSGSSAPRDPARTPDQGAE